MRGDVRCCLRNLAQEIATRQNLSLRNCGRCSRRWVARTRPPNSHGTILAAADRVWPSGVNRTRSTSPMWPSFAQRSFPVATSQRRIVASSLAEASVLPSGENASPLMWDVCPDPFQRICQFVVSRTWMTLSKSAQANSVPSTEKTIGEEEVGGNALDCLKQTASGWIPAPQ